MQYLDSYRCSVSKKKSCNVLYYVMSSHTIVTVWEKNYHWTKMKQTSSCSLAGLCFDKQSGNGCCFVVFSYFNPPPSWIKMIICLFVEVPCCTFHQSLFWFSHCANHFVFSPSLSSTQQSQPLVFQYCWLFTLFTVWRHNLYCNWSLFVSIELANNWPFLLQAHILRVSISLSSRGCNVRKTYTWQICCPSYLNARCLYTDSSLLTQNAHQIICLCKCWSKC